MLFNSSATSNKSGNFSGLKLGVGFSSLNQDFIMPPEFTKVKQLGKGSYGKVMHILHKPT
jgi:hypothetical protein